MSETEDRAAWLHTNCAWFTEAQEAHRVIRELRNSFAMCNPPKVVWGTPGWVIANRYLAKWSENYPEETTP